MSCYVVDDETISAMVVWTLRYRGGFGPIYRAAGFDIHSISGYGRDWDAVREVAQVLLNANIDSVNVRYHEKRKPHSIFLDKYFADYGDLSPVQILRFCDVYDYQTCELPNWETSEARQVTKAIRNLAIRQLPGYQEAKATALDIPRKTKPRNVIELTSLLAN